jgi:hypothetical protein
MSQVDCQLAEIETGQPVQVYFEAWSDEVTVPKFRLVP